MPVRERVGEKVAVADGVEEEVTLRVTVGVVDRVAVYVVEGEGTAVPVVGVAVAPVESRP